MLGSTIFQLGVAGADAVATYAPSTVFQAWIAGVCFAGACRRYRRDDRPALGWDLGLLLLAAWVVTSAFGIVYWEQFQPSMMRGSSVNPAAQFVGSTIVAMLLALVPLGGAAWLAAEWEGRRAMGDATLGRHPPPPALVAFAAAVVTLLLVLAPVTLRTGEASLDGVVRTGIVLVAFYLATAYVLRILVRVTTKVLYPMLVWLMLSWLAPMSVDYVGWWMEGAYSESMLGVSSSFGPVGALLAIWTGDPAVSTPGIIFQAVLAAAMAAAYYTTRSRWTRQPAGARQ
jgi:hypothetical protein